MEFLSLPGYLLAKAFKYAVGEVSEARNLRAKQIAAMAGIDEPVMSKLKSGKQGLEKAHIEKLEAVFPGFTALIENYLSQKLDLEPDKIEQAQNKLTSETEFLRNQVELWQMMYFKATNMSESEREAFIKKISGR